MIRPAVVILAALLVGGCASPFVEHHPGSPLVTREAVEPGVYTLYSGSRERIESTTVGFGEPVGFRMEAAHLIAIAGSERVALDEGRYFWQIEEPRQAGPRIGPYHPPLMFPIPQAVARWPWLRFTRLVTSCMPCLPDRRKRHRRSISRRSCERESIAFSPDGKFLATGTSGSFDTLVWDAFVCNIKI